MTNVSNNDIAQAIHLFFKEKKEKGQVSETIKQVLTFLNNRRLLPKSNDILVKLQKMIDEEEGKIKVKVFSARNLNQNTKNKINFLLKDHYKAREIILEEKIDPKLLGGMRMEINNEVIDLTIKNKIKKLQEYLIKKHE